MNCDYSYARDCSECNEPVCRRSSYHTDNDYNDPYDLRGSYLSPNDYDDPYDDYPEEDR